MYRYAYYFCNHFSDPESNILLAVQKISQITPNYRYVDGTPTLPNLVIS